MIKTCTGMNKSLLSNIITLLFLGLCTVSFGQNFTGIYTFADVKMTTGKVDPTAVPVATGIDFGSFHVVGNTSTNPNANARFSFQNWPFPRTASINLGEYDEVIITPQSNYALILSKITFTVQRSATGINQFSVRSSADNYSSNLPASFTGNQFTVNTDNVFKVVDTSTITAVANCIITFSNVAQSVTADTLRFYGWGASAPGGTFSLNRVEIAGAANAATGTPRLTIDSSSLGFPVTYINSTTTVKQYTVQGSDLSDPVTVITTAPYSVSDAVNGTYATSLTLAAADVATPKPVYVKFAPVTAGNFNSTVSNTSTGASALNVALTGVALDPANLSFNFNSCTALGTPGSGFTTYSVTGPQGFACSQFGRNGTNGVDINGYSGGGGVDNEDWLISPQLLIGSQNAPVLSFYSRGEFSGPSLQLLVSTNYTGSGNPNNATWTDLQAPFPPLTNTWTLTDGINLSAYKSYPTLYIAFKYTSSPELNAARWTLDDVYISDRSKLLTANPVALNFGEITSGNNSAGQAFSIQGFGYGDITVSAPSGYQVSTDNSTFSTSIQVDSVSLLHGDSIYTRFSPVTKSIKIGGNIRFSGNGLDSSVVTLTGSSYPKAETFDVGAYNLSFFGANASNTADSGEITKQVNNIATVMRHINLDVIGVEEVSNDSAMTVLVSKLPGYNFVLSNRWSYSFNPPTPNFPAQKTGFVYNELTSKMVEKHVMFEGLFDSLRNNLKTLPAYPDSSSHFWASGRLPFMVTFDVTINGIVKRIRMIDIHGKANATGDATPTQSYNRRAYDAKVLKDTLDTYYKNDNIILVGDYNDRVYGSINSGLVSPYNIFVADTANYQSLDYPLDSAGRVSFITGTGLIDHIIISNELKRNYISNSTDIEDARTYISSYNATTASDHLPIYTRMTLTEQAALPVKLTRFNAESAGHTVLLSWKTEQENNNDHFVIERSGDGHNFSVIALVPGAGTSTLSHTYQHVDSLPVPGISYYRLRQVDFDGKATVSNTVTVKIGEDAAGLSIYPNPVGSYLQLNGVSFSTMNYSALVTTTEGKVMLQVKGTVNRINQVLNQQIGKLKAGMYIFYLKSADTQRSLKFIKQ